MTETGLYDSHAHLADERLYPRLDRILDDFRRAGGRGVLAVAAEYADWERLDAISRREGVWGAIGVHPLRRQGWEPGDGPSRLAAMLAANPALRAVGEIGLDFQEGRGDAAAQTARFRDQLAVAAAADYPVVFHNRRSWREFFAVLDGSARAVRGVCHNFTGSRELAREILDRGLLISFGGPLTWPNVRRAREAARYIPLERLLVETDAPDLPPRPRRADFSTPADVARVLTVLAGLRGMSPASLAEHLAENFARLFLAPRRRVETLGSA